MRATFCVLLFLLCCVSAAAAAEPVTVALWLFDEPAEAPRRALIEDQTTHGYDLTLDTGARIAPGKFGNALEIMGGGGRTAMRRYIDPTPLNLGEFDWTWDLWVTMKAAARAGDVIFEIRQGPFDEGPRTALAVGSKAGELLFICQSAGIAGQLLSSDGDVFGAKTANWHHVALTYQAGEHRLTHWIDGRKRDSVVLPAALQTLKPTGENNLTVGGDVNGWHPLPAIIDEARFSKGVIYREDFAPPESLAPRRGAIALGPGPHLFIDETLIERAQNLKRTTHQPQRLPDPIIREREIRPGWVRQCGGNTVMYDADAKRFRMWMCVKNQGFEEADFYAMTYWESSDGVRWREPELGVIEFDSHRRHNILMTGRTHNLRFHSDSVLDEGASAVDPQRRYKVGYFPLDWRQDRTNGMNVAFSPDGIHWTAYEKNPVLRHPDVEQGHAGAGLSVADINDMFYDEQRKLYVQTYKTYALPHEYPMAAPRRDARWREINDKVPGYRRIIGMCTSPDFVHWTNHQRIMVPDDRDTPELQFYAMSIIKRGDLYVAHVRCLDDQAEEDGTGWMELATSRDLYHWTRHRDVFFDRNPIKGSWDGKITWHGRPVIVDDEMWFYYTGMGAGHKTGERHTGLAKLRKDGYVSRDAGEERGTLVTSVFNPDASSMTVNAKVAGELRVRVVGEDGAALPGFDFADAAALQGDSVAHPVRWKGNFGSLRGKPVRLEFDLQDTKLYGFALAE
jgi:hypothetical protein